MRRRHFISKTGMALAGAAVIPTAMAKQPTNNVIRLGIIGTGSRGQGLISILNEIQELEVMACCDTLPFRLQKGLEKVGKKAKGYTDYRALLDNKEIDAVIIATPFSCHGKMALDAMDAAKHIYCEKTLAKGYEAIKKIADKATTSNKIFQTGHQYHNSRLYTHVVDLIKKGEIGKLTAIDCQWNRNNNWRRPVPIPEYEKQINWRMYREFSGGLLAELCSHQLDFSNWLLDDVPIKVIGDGGIDYWKDGRETYDNIHMIYTYSSGVRATFTCLTSNSKDDYQIKILGDKGTITIGYTEAWLYPEKKPEDKEIGELDGVSGATIDWNQSKGIPIKVTHLDPTKQALYDFGQSITYHSKPKSDMLTGAKTAVCVQMGLDALYNKKAVDWNPNVL